VLWLVRRQAELGAAMSYGLGCAKFQHMYPRGRRAGSPLCFRARLRRGVLGRARARFRWAAREGAAARVSKDVALRSHARWGCIACNRAVLGGNPVLVERGGRKSRSGGGACVTVRRRCVHAKRGGRAGRRSGVQARRDDRRQAVSHPGGARVAVRRDGVSRVPATVRSCVRMRRASET
jgi:hypothetical protein